MATKNVACALQKANQGCGVWRVSMGHHLAALGRRRSSFAPPLLVEQAGDDEHKSREGRPANLPWSDGTSHLLLSPMELLEKLAALVPPPRFPSPALPRGPGTPGPRDRIVPAKPVAEPSAADGAASVAPCSHRLWWGDPAGAGVFLRPQRMRRLWWVPADRRRLTDPTSIRTYLEGVRAAGGCPGRGARLSRGSRFAA